MKISRIIKYWQQQLKKLGDVEVKNDLDLLSDSTGSDAVDYAIVSAAAQSTHCHDLISVKHGADVMRDIAINAARVCCEHYASGDCMGGEDYTYQTPEEKRNCWEICKNGHCPFFLQLKHHIDDYYYVRESWQDYYHNVPYNKSEIK